MKRRMRKFGVEMDKGIGLRSSGAQSEVEIKQDLQSRTFILLCEASSLHTLILSPPGDKIIKSAKADRINMRGEDATHSKAHYNKKYEKIIFYFNIGFWRNFPSAWTISNIA